MAQLKRRPHRLDRLRALRYHHKLIFSVLIVCGILAVSDRGLAARLTRDFERDIRVSRKLDLDTWRRRPFLEKARELCWTYFGEVL